LQRSLQNVDETNISQPKSGNRSMRSSQSTTTSIEAVDNANREKTRRRLAQANHPAMLLDQVLPESAMRADFLEIVRDLRSQAEVFERSKPMVSYIDKNELLA
jgi:hypothetical protein